MRKPRFTIITIVMVLIALLALSVFIVIAYGTIGKQFCTQNPGPTINRITFNGQGRSLSITDREVLDYLKKQPKLGSLPREIDDSAGGMYFDAVVYNRIGIPGQFAVDVDKGKKYLLLEYYTSPVSDTTSSFCLIDSNAPPKLNEALDFLLSETNRGKALKM